MEPGIDQSSSPFPAEKRRGDKWQASSYSTSKTLEIESHVGPPNKNELKMFGGYEPDIVEIYTVENVVKKTAVMGSVLHLLSPEVQFAAIALDLSRDLLFRSVSPQPEKSNSDGIQPKDDMKIVQNARGDRVEISSNRLVGLVKDSGLDPTIIADLIEIILVTRITHEKKVDKRLNLTATDFDNNLRRLVRNLDIGYIIESNTADISNLTSDDDAKKIREKELGDLFDIQQNPLDTMPELPKD